MARLQIFQETAVLDVILITMEKTEQVEQAEAVRMEQRCSMEGMVKQERIVQVQMTKAVAAVAARVTALMERMEV